ncbi:hypothetical protein Dsin_015042 [Dipteronia sinensis]|uniref:NB-ARC domain-containing protein n=1 Tax=Dipteronia sinensis TaxID=43782 RepID=A0AAE0ANB6_9ROSI|nr:hypothetical protein Dsin_015042 [Dipteronia sinensis]
MGGIGKTVLARRIYNNEWVESHFQFRVWVSVGGYLDIATVAETIVIDHKTLTSENRLEPREVLGEKTFLIVLDVWDEDGIRLEKLKAWLNVGHLGTCVLVTTRFYSCGSFDGHPAKNLTCLSDEESWALFKYWAFKSREQENAEFEKIGFNIVAKCKGLSLAVKTIGGLLRSKSVQEWFSVMRDGLWKLPKFKSRVLPVLKLTYDRLPSYLKQCFVHYLIFPKAYWINKEKLVRCGLLRVLLD